MNTPPVCVIVFFFPMKLIFCSFKNRICLFYYVKRKLVTRQKWGNSENNLNNFVVVFVGVLLVHSIFDVVEFNPNCSSLVVYKDWMNGMNWGSMNNWMVNGVHNWSC